jgi:hypothetical protein
MPKVLDTQPQRDVTFETNRDHWRNRLRILKAQHDEIATGGGEGAAAKQKQKSKLLARERVDALIDEGTEFLEIGSFAAWGLYEEWGGAPGGGVVSPDLQKDPSRAGNRDGEPAAADLPGRLGGGLSSHAGRHLPRQGPFWPGLL